MKRYTIQDLYDQNLIIFSSIIGSHAYGTNIPTSDIDLRGVYIQPLEDILGFGYIDQVSDETNDTTFYEIRRFLELIQTNNPNILELLNVPEDCIKYKNPIFDIVLQNKEKFITKQCKNSFAGYAIGQIKKARGYNKKINWEENEMTQKTVLDFCYVLQSGRTILLQDWLNKNAHSYYDCNITYKNFCLAKIDHSHDLYAMYKFGDFGIVSDPEKANDVQLISVPKEIPLIGYLTFNKDVYSSHCKKYKEYTEWLENRNEDRFKMNKQHGKNYDSKNMMHTFRLLNMTKEIVKREIIVRRPEEEIKTLLAIRKGEYDYDKLLNEAEKLISDIDKMFDESDLPKTVDKDFVNEILIQIRKKRYEDKN